MAKIAEAVPQDESQENTKFCITYQVQCSSQEDLDLALKHHTVNGVLTCSVTSQTILPEKTTNEEEKLEEDQAEAHEELSQEIPPLVATVYAESSGSPQKQPQWWQFILF